jgi:predicted O-methyltransferase YrrM
MPGFRHETTPLDERAKIDTLLRSQTTMKPIAPETAIEQALRESPNVDLSWIVPPPAADGWTLAPDALRFVTRIVEVLQPRHILELGSGLSTRVLSRTASALSPKCVISSVDHDPQYNYETAGAPADQEGAKVKFQLAPLVVREFGGKLLGAYLIQGNKLAAKRPVDLVVIDGPPVNLGGREGTLYQIMDYARPGTVVLLDDSKRPEEKAALKAWQDNLGDAVSVQQLPGFGKGMAAVIINRPIPAKNLWHHRFLLSKQELEAMVPHDQSVILAGETWWGDELLLDRPILPFTEKEGQYWGDPADDAAALAELEKLTQRGARFFAFGWPTFWWLPHYKGLIEELTRRGRKALDNDRMVVFELR